MKYSTKIERLVNQIISERTLVNAEAQNELAKEITHGVLELNKNAVSKMKPKTQRELEEVFK